MSSLIKSDIDDPGLCVFEYRLYTLIGLIPQVKTMGSCSLLKNELINSSQIHNYNVLYLIQQGCFGSDKIFFILTEKNFQTPPPYINVFRKMNKNVSVTSFYFETG
jgi:hypothetical protein